MIFFCLQPTNIGRYWLANESKYRLHHQFQLSTDFSWFKVQNERVTRTLFHDIYVLAITFTWLLIFVEIRSPADIRVDIRISDAMVVF